MHWRDALHSKATLIVLFLFVLCLSACGIFETRDPESPDTSNETLPPATTPDYLMSNFTTAFMQKNVQEYEKLFADTVTHSRSFVFVPNQSAAATYPFFTEWDKTAESNYFKKIVNEIGPSSSPQISFTYANDPVLYHSDSAFYTVDYNIFVPHKRADLTTKFVGRSEFYLSPDKNNIWTIYRWVDFETNKDSSWSELKGQFYSQ